MLLMPLERVCFTFVNGFIPIANDDYVDFEEFEFYRRPNSRCWVEPSAYGPTVVFDDVATEYQNYLFTGPTDLKVNHEDLYRDYQRYLSEC
jgi:hypothetical protein